MSAAPAPAVVIAALVDSIVEMEAYNDVPGAQDDPVWQAIRRRGADALIAVDALKATPGLEEAVERCAKIAEDLDGKGGGYGDYPSGWDAACSRIASDIRALTRGDGRELGAATPKTAQHRGCSVTEEDTNE